MVEVLYILYENRTMKTTEIVLSMGGGLRKNDCWDKLNQVNCKQIWKCHNETPCSNNKC
jgi:hypothetical protein